MPCLAVQTRGFLRRLADTKRALFRQCLRAAFAMTLPLKITDLTVKSPRGRRLLTLPQLSAQPGETLGICGPSGAGKSTLLLAIAGLTRRCSGVVKWGETDLLTLSDARRAAFRARHIGFIFQDFLLFDELSAADNAAVTALFRPTTTRVSLRQRAMKLLERLELDITSRTVSSFSGGERQRVAVARALAHDPAILLADEPTANLDRTAADALISDLIALSRDKTKTLIVVSHDPTLLDRMDRVITLNDGLMEPTNV